MMKLPIPENKVTKRKSGFWGVRTKVFGRKEDPKTEDINYNTLAHGCDMGMNSAFHDAIARMSYHHRVELGTHYFGRHGWQKPEGAHILLTDEQRVKFSPVLMYNQELEHYIKNLQMDLLLELFENDALRAAPDLAMAMRDLLQALLPMELAFNASPPQIQVGSTGSGATMTLSDLSPLDLHLPTSLRMHPPPRLPSVSAVASTVKLTRYIFRFRCVAFSMLSS
ncbi:hypothetical protein D1007_12804 [Hordeum vulgare]|nr:hypothetical protein D1007_12804 [Hordeum vulgare]